MDLLHADDNTYVNGMKSCRQYLREASDYEESQIKLHINEKIVLFNSSNKKLKF